MGGSLAAMKLNALIKDSVSGSKAYALKINSSYHNQFAVLEIAANV